MKKILPILLVACFLIYFSSCEKDDICVEGDTPLLVVGFFNIADTTLAKRVPSIRIVAIANNTVLDNDSFNDRTTSPDSLFVPLQIGANSTSYLFINNSDENAGTGEETGNLDTLSIDYINGEAFISRACGFVANFNDLSVTRTEGTDNWIQDIKVVQQNVENSNTIHVKIFH